MRFSNEVNQRPGNVWIIVIIAAVVAMVFFTAGMMFLTYQRAVARSVVCQQNMRSIALGSHNYHDSYKRLPPGSIGYSYNQLPELKDWESETHKMSWRNKQNTSALGCIMPYMELNQLMDRIHPAAFDSRKSLDQYREASPEFSGVAWQADIQGAVEVAQEEIPMYVCPADYINGFDGETIIASQQVKNSANKEDDLGLQSWTDASARLGKTNYSGCGGAIGGSLATDPQRYKWIGTMHHGRVTLETISDGAGSTIMYGENIGGIKDGQRFSAYSWFWAGCSRGRGDAPYLKPGSDAAPLIGNSRYSSPYGFGSMHSGGFTTAFADSAVRFLNSDIDVEVFYALCGARDGERIHMEFK